MAEKVQLTSADYARLAVDVAAEKQATDIWMLDIRGVTDFADYFVILTGESSRQIDTVAEEIWASLKRENAHLHHREGTTDSGWVLLDFGDVVVHIFGPAEREYYKLGEHWGKAVTVVRIQ